MKRGVLMRKTKANNRRNIEKIRRKKMQDQGVTMVALVVTIIILLILSGITIRFVICDW